VADWAGPLAAAVRNLLITDPTVKAITIRVYPMGSADNPAYPYITYVCPLTDRQEYCYAVSDPQLNIVRLQVDVWATTYTGAVALYDAVFACLGKAEVTVSGWGTAKLFPDVAGGVISEEVGGTKIWRGMRRYWVMLAQ
jgi:hypothetical protein